jgi:hypothetical protein
VNLEDPLEPRTSIEKMQEAEEAAERETVGGRCITEPKMLRKCRKQKENHGKS